MMIVMVVMRMNHGGSSGGNNDGVVNMVKMISYGDNNSSNGEGCGGVVGEGSGSNAKGGECDGGSGWCSGQDSGTDDAVVACNNISC